MTHELMVGDHSIGKVDAAVLARGLPDFITQRFRLLRIETDFAFEVVGKPVRRLPKGHKRVGARAR